METELIVYGTTWCHDCKHACSILDREKIAYRFVNIEHDQAGLNFVTQANHGNRSVPTIVFPDGSILVEPNERVLMEKLAALSASVSPTPQNPPQTK